MAMTDKELVSRCQKDAAAFEELLRRYGRTVYAYAAASTGSRQDAEEVTQDVFVKVYRAAHRFDSRYSFTTWLYKIAANTCKNKLRARHRMAPISLDDDETGVAPASDVAGPLDAYRQAIETGAVREAIQALPPPYREVLYLRYVQGLTYRDIGEVLGLTVGNVEARIFRGKEKVRETLQRRAAAAESGRPGHERRWDA